ncbi:hypothetical protein LEN26_007334 [Aphanomyces euteiches]|nr:hypothetical protein AeMF1_018374 [Aphanomyces euteiches]KAH9132653.1 hypothetical protein LEN26_007334 [Aphanomyces euteiches]
MNMAISIPTATTSTTEMKALKRQQSAKTNNNNSNHSTECMSPTKRARLVGNLTISVSANLLKSDEYRGRCKYKSGRCPNERTIKFSGEPHTLCEEHRVKHNKNQRKSDAKRRGVVKTKRDVKSELQSVPVKKEHKPPTDNTIKLEPIDATTLSTTVLTTGWITHDEDTTDDDLFEEIDMSETSSCWSEDEVEILKNIFDCDIPLEL